MSLSKYFKDNGSFTPKSLVSGSQKQTGDWMPATLPGDEQSVPLPGKDIPETVHQNVESSEEQPAEAAVTPDSSDQKEKTDDIALDTGTQEPAAVIPDIEELQKEAYDAGLKQGLKQAQADFGSAQTALTLLCDQLSTIRETILKNSKDEMVELVIALSEKIIRHSVTEQHQTIVDTVDSAIHQAVKSSEFYIYVHPEDLSIIQDHTQSFISGLNGLENIVVKADPGIERGGCRIESDNSTVDATIGSQFAVLKDSIREKKRST